MSFDGIPGTPGTKMVPPEVGQQHLAAWCETTLPGLLLRFEDLAQDSLHGRIAAVVGRYLCL